VAQYHWQGSCCERLCVGSGEETAEKGRGASGTGDEGLSFGGVVAVGVGVEGQRGNGG
jgi:hypothetical protein